MTHTTETDAPRPFFGPHEILEVRQADGMPYVKCACGVNPMTHVWLSAHWGGDQDEGVAAIRRVISMQAARVTPPASSAPTPEDA